MCSNLTLWVDLDLLADRLDEGEDPKVIAAEIRRWVQAEVEADAGEDL